MSKELDKALTDKKRLFLLYGQEQYLLEKNMEKIIHTYLREEETDLNLEVIESLPKDMRDLLNKCETLPFMADYRVVVLKNTGIFEHKDKDGLDLLTKRLEQLPESTVVIVKEKEADKRKKLFKLFQSAGCVEEQDYLTEDKLVAYLGKWFYRYQLRIKTETAKLLIQRAGEELTGLLQECEKLAALATDVVTDEMVIALVQERLESKIFQLTDALGRKDRQTAMENYQVMLQNRESAVGILAMIGRQLRQISQMKLLIEKRTPATEMAKLLGVKPFIINKLTAQTKMFSTEELNAFMQEIVQLEWDYKRGKADLETGIAMLIVRAGKRN